MQNDAAQTTGLVSTTAMRYTVQSSDVLSDMRINVYREGAQAVLWYKERFLFDEEIVDHIVDNATSTIQWTIHRPKRGWYIRLRAPSFPPGSFVSLTPLAQSSSYYTEAALSFACRTNAPAVYSAALSGSDRSLDSQVTLTDTPRDLHSYPPSPPQSSTTQLRSPSPPPPSIQSRLSEVRLSLSTPRSQVTNFVLAPTVTTEAPTVQARSSLFTRVLSAIKSTVPSHSSSFTLAPIPPPPSARAIDVPIPPPTPLLTYTDRTPLWTANATYGLIELDHQREQELGVQTSFYIAVALTYLDFLMDRESYLAAEAD